MRLLLTFSILFASITHGQVVKGTVIDVQRAQPITFAIITLISKDKRRHVELSDETGSFVFSNLSSTTYTVNFSAIGYRDTTFMDVLLTKDTTLHLTYLRNCPYDTSINNKSCPECQKKDRVIPIIYGLPMSLNDEDPTKGNGEEVHPRRLRNQ